MVKTADLPGFTFRKEELNQYNKRVAAYTSVEYQPVTLTFHDDSANVVLSFWADYYRNFVADSMVGRPAYQRDLYQPNRANRTNAWGLDAGQSRKPDFIKAIDIYTLSQQQFTMYSLQMPWIESFKHGQLDQSNTSELLTHSMTVGYAGVLYGQGKVSRGNPPGFADLFYDFSPSPLSLAGGGTQSLFGRGGVLQGAASVFGDIASGNITLGTIFNGARVLRNGSRINKDMANREIGSVGRGVFNCTSNNPLSSVTIPRNTGSFL